MIPIADISGMLGMAFFLAATTKQLHKTYKTKSTSGISITQYKLKVIAIICTMICFYLTNLWLSFTAVSIELFISLSMVYLLTKYRKKKFYREMTGEQFIKEIKEW